MSGSIRAGVREHGASILVSGLSAAFGVVLIGAVNVLATAVRQSQGGELVQAPLTTVSAIFFIISLYVGAIVTSNTFSTVIAGRTRQIALLRLIGATARQQRRAVAAEGLRAGLVGALAGGAIGAALSLASVPLLVGSGVLPDLRYQALSPAMLAPVVVVVFTTWFASWRGSRRIVTVSPIEALGVATQQGGDALPRRGLRLFLALAVLVVGTAAMAFGVALPRMVPVDGPEAEIVMAAAIAVAFVGGLLSFSGVLMCARFFVPGLLGAAGRLLGRSAPARLAAANATRHPARSTRMTVGLVIGVTIVSGFQVAQTTFLDILRDALSAEPDFYAAFTDIETTLTSLITVFSILVGFSAVIAAVGLANNLSLSVVQRTRELGLLRALGFTRRQVRLMILAESTQITLTAVVIGLVLGIVYGWAAAQSLLGAIPGARLAPPALPVAYLVLVVVMAALLAAAAAIAPTRRAVRVSPVEALSAA